MKRATTTLAIAGVTFLLVILVTSAWPKPADDEGQVIFTNYSSGQVLFLLDQKYPCIVPPAPDQRGLSCAITTTRGEHTASARVGDDESRQTVRVEGDTSLYGDRVYLGVCQVSRSTSFSCNDHP